MEAINNVVVKTKELILGESEVKPKDIAKAVEKVEHLQHKKLEHDIEAEKKIADAALKLNKKQHDRTIEKLDGTKEISEAAEDFAHEQRKKLLVDVEATEKINEAAAEAQVKKAENFISGDFRILPSNVVHAVEKQYDEQHHQFKKDVHAEKKILSAAKDLEKETYKQKVNLLEADKEVAKAADKVMHEREKKLEQDLKDEEKIRKAAEKVDQLRMKQLEQQEQRCHTAVANTTNPADGATVVQVTKTTVIH